MCKTNDQEWWRHAVIYQIYPRSFLDSNGDGIGDLAGITQKMDYIADLGVDGIWISPFFTSPMKDFGYDVSDYRNIDPTFGTLKDFDALLTAAHKLGLKIIIDLVLSHSSNEHPWFKDEQKKDWYVWADGITGDNGNQQPPNNWQSVFGGSAWEWDDHHQQFYLHNFLKEQPDFNFHNMAVQNEMLDICKFWLDRGVDGFRLDTVNFYFHDELLRDNPPRTHGTDFATQYEVETPYSAQQHIYDKSQPENLDFIARMRNLTDQYDARMMVGEIGDDHPYACAREYTRGAAHLHTTYNTHLMSGSEKEVSADLIREPIEKFFTPQTESVESAISLKNTQDIGWPSWAFSNHDVVRAASRWTTLYEHHPDFSKLIIVLLGCLPGTLFLYQGEELGLPELEIPYDSLQDPWAKETWPEWQGRDGCRTPMPWTTSNPYAGFSNHKPWLPVIYTDKSLCVQHQAKDSNSTLNFTRKFLKWRKNYKNLLKSDFKFLQTSHSKIIHIVRGKTPNETHCIFNLSGDETVYLKRSFAPYEFHIDQFCED